MQGVVQAWWQHHPTLEQASKALLDPTELVVEVSAALRESYEERSGQSFRQLSQTLRSAPYVLLPKVFDPRKLPETPDTFNPVPDVEATLRARLSAVVALGGLGMETVSYGSENGGELFVNLVVLSGNGRLPEKSRDAMRGHTDAVTFPFRGTSDQLNPDIAPSPDFVCLVGLRNPDAVGTTVMSMGDVLPNLSAQQIHELKQPQFDIRAQKTFIPGMQLILAEEHGVDDGEILVDVDDQTWVRYSHSSVLAEDCR